MNILHQIVKALVTLGLLVLGLLLLADVVGVQAPAVVFVVSRLGKFLVGISAVFLVLLFWLTAVPTKTEQFLTLDNQGGAIHVSVKAVNDLLGRLASEFAGIGRLRAEVAPTRDGKVDVQLVISVRSGNPVQQITEVLQQRVRETLREHLGIPEVTAVKIRVDEIVGAGEPAARQPSDRADWQDTPT